MVLVFGIRDLKCVFTCFYRFDSRSECSSWATCPEYLPIDNIGDATKMVQHERLGGKGATSRTFASIGGHEPKLQGLAKQASHITRGCNLVVSFSASKRRSFFEEAEFWSDTFRGCGSPVDFPILWRPPLRVSYPAEGANIEMKVGQSRTLILKTSNQGQGALMPCEGAVQH